MNLAPWKYYSQLNWQITSHTVADHTTLTAKEITRHLEKTRCSQTNLQWNQGKQKGETKQTPQDLDTWSISP